MDGDWVINQAVYTRAGRDIIRRKLGCNLKFVILTVCPEVQVKRLAKRNASGFSEAGALNGEVGDVTEEAMEQAREENTKLVGGFENAQNDEPSTLTLEIAEDMSVGDVARNILEFINRI